MSKNARSRPSLRSLSVEVPRGNSVQRLCKVCPFTVLFTGCFSDALSIQSYGARPQAKTLEVTLRSTAGLSNMVK